MTAYEVAIQTADLRLSRVEVTTTKAEAIKTARELARTSGGKVAWVHVFNIPTALSVVSFQALNKSLA
jgi:hypothetical protein